MKEILFLTAFLATFLASSDCKDVSWKLPLDKAQIVYHHQKICLTVGGEERCVNKDTSPGDPEEVAKLFHVMQEFDVSVEGGDTSKLKGAGINDLLPPWVVDELKKQKRTQLRRLLQDLSEKADQDDQDQENDRLQAQANEDPDANTFYPLWK